MAQAKKRPVVDNEVQGDLIFPMGPLSSPPPSMHQETILMKTHLIAPIQAIVGISGSAPLQRRYRRLFNSSLEEDLTNQQM